MKNLIFATLLLFVIGLATNICYADSSPPVMEISIDVNTDIELQTVTWLNINKPAEISEGRIAVYNSDPTYWPSCEAIMTNVCKSNFARGITVSYMSFRDQWFKDINRRGASMKELLPTYNSPVS